MPMQACECDNDMTCDGHDDTCPYHRCTCKPDHSPDPGQMVVSDMVPIHPAMAAVLPEILTQIGAELEAIQAREPSMDDIQRRVYALNGPDRTSAMLDCAVMFAALYATFRAMERQSTSH